MVRAQSPNADRDAKPRRGSPGARAFLRRRVSLCVSLALLLRAGHGTAQDAVLYVTEARLGRVAAYRIGANGHVHETPFQHIDTGPDTNPRRLAVHPNACALYVATGNNIEVFQIASDGHLSRFTHDEDTLASMRDIKPANYQFLAVHPAGLALYASLTALDQIREYALNPDGSLRRAFTTSEPPVEKDPPVASCVQGVQQVRYQGLIATETSLYAAGHAPPQIEIFPLDAAGAIESVPLRPPANPDDDDILQVPQVYSDCKRNRPTFAHRFSTARNKKKFLNPKTLLLDPVAGIIYAADRFLGRIFGCFIAADGGLPDCPGHDKDVTNNTGLLPMQSKVSAAYEQMVLSEDWILFASVFPNGRVRAFRPVPAQGKIKRRKAKSNDVFATPVGLAVKGQILYVAQGELDRIDQFAIDSDGFKNEDPLWETDKIKQSFPNGVIVVTPNQDPAACAATSTTTSTTPSVSTSTTTTVLATTTTTTL